MAQSTALKARKNGHIVVDIEKFKFKNVAGHIMHPIDLGMQAEDIQGTVNGYSQNFFLMAKACSNVDEFSAICEAVERAMYWGRKPANALPEDAEKWHGAPDTWRVLKSTIKGAWGNYDVKPGTTITYTTDENEETTLDVSGINRLKEAVKLVKGPAPRTRSKIFNALIKQLETIEQGMADDVEARQKFHVRITKVVKDYSQYMPKA